MKKKNTIAERLAEFILKNIEVDDGRRIEDIKSISHGANMLRENIRCPERVAIQKAFTAKEIAERIKCCPTSVYKVLKFLLEGYGFERIVQYRKRFNGRMVSRYVFKASFKAEEIAPWTRQPTVREKAEECFREIGGGKC